MMESPEVFIPPPKPAPAPVPQKVIVYPPPPIPMSYPQHPYVPSQIKRESPVPPQFYYPPPAPPAPPPVPHQNAAAGPSNAPQSPVVPKKKITRVGHGVGSGGANNSTYKNKPMAWVPPPTYPYNLIPGRDLTAPVIPPRPPNPESVQEQPFYPESTYKPSGNESLSTKPKRKRNTRKIVEQDIDWDDSDDLIEVRGKRDDADDDGTPASSEVDVVIGTTARQKERAKQKAEAAARQPPPPLNVPKKPGYREKTEKAKLLEQEKEEREKEKAERAAARAASSKVKGSDKDKDKAKSSAGSSKSSNAKGGSKGKSVAFVANQGVRVDGARNAVHEEFEDDDDLDEEVEIDTRLYCVCKQMYDDDRIMIACDNCDDWCHPGCVGLPEADLDLVDLFYCPNCQASHNIQTTYKVACGQCRRPARLPLSKFCSDECGVQCVMKRVDEWCASLDKTAGLEPIAFPRKSRSPSEMESTTPPHPALQRLESSSAVRLAKRREGLVSVEPGMDEGATLSGRKAEEERTLARYREMLAKVRTEWAQKVQALAGVQARLALLDVAVQRVEWFEFNSGTNPSTCGYDARLCMDEVEWVDWVESDGGRRAFEGYGIGDEVIGNDEEREQELEVIGRSVCRNKKKCDRHSGWQTLRRSDFELEQRLLDEALQRLKVRQQDIRSRIDDIEVLQTPPESAAGDNAASGTDNVDIVHPDSPMQVDHRQTAVVQAPDQHASANGVSNTHLENGVGDVPKFENGGPSPELDEKPFMDVDVQEMLPTRTTDPRRRPVATPVVEDAVMTDG